MLFLTPWRRERSCSDGGLKPQRLRQHQAEYRGASELLSSPSCITVSRNWKRRNTNLDIAGYLHDIGPFKATAAVCICKHFSHAVLNNGLFLLVEVLCIPDKEPAV